MPSEELFKDVPGFEGLYSVTSLGRVWSHPRPYSSGGWLAGARSRDGYRYVTLRKDGQNHSRRISRLVLEMFVGPAPEGAEADHRNNIRDDDRPENLQWLSHLENVRRIWGQGRRTMRGGSNPRCFLTEATVREIRQKRVTTGASYQALARHFGLRKGHVADICAYRIWKT